MKNINIANILGVVYYHVQTSDGGDLYLTRFAKPYKKHLNISNWFEKNWFEEHRVKLAGTSTVYKVPTRVIDGTSLDLVVKYCRVGEDVPVNTHTIKQFCNAEFNSPWEEFTHVTEMREGRFGPPEVRLKTQEPLAIYVPPEPMQMWQSGRCRHKISKITSRHPGIELDILKQYLLIYAWIPGKDIVELFETLEMDRTEMIHHVRSIDGKVSQEMLRKGYQVADMKPQHIIIGKQDVESINGGPSEGSLQRQIQMIYDLIHQGRYSIIDYELLNRTAEHEQAVKHFRRNTYLEDQHNKFLATAIPEHLSSVEIFGVPFVYGHAESTGGRLWVVGRNARLFDYFLPERWRKTPYLSLSKQRNAHYTVTKDNIHIVWKTSRVGEIPLDPESGQLKTGEGERKAHGKGINSLFEKVAIAHDLRQRGISTVYIRAIYMTGSRKVEKSQDTSRYETHKDLLDPEGNPILLEDHNYISIRGYFNGYDEWVVNNEDNLYTPVNLDDAVERGLISAGQRDSLLCSTVSRLRDAGYDGTLLEGDDLLIAIDKEGRILQQRDGGIDAVICNLELIWRLQ